MKLVLAIITLKNVKGLAITNPMRSFWNNRRNHRSTTHSMGVNSPFAMSPSSLELHILITQAGELGGTGLRDSPRTVDVEHRMIVTRLTGAIEVETGEALDRLPDIEMGTIK